ncbi:MAG: TonB-dependent receptor, partial [Mangrovibacterium sp.]
MKLTVFLLCITALGSLAKESYSQETKLTIVLQNASIEDALKEIENQSKYRFFYNDKIDVNRQVSVNLVDKKIDDVLDELLSQTNIRYEFIDRQIVLSSNKTMQQKKTVSGRVIDPSGLPLPGVTVMVKGSTSGTVADANGNYTLGNVDPGATLVFSFIGMKTQEIAVNEQSIININMEEETTMLDELVAIGYGSAKKKDITGSVASMNAEELSAVPVSSPVEAMTGKLAGVRVITPEGSPDADVIIRVRGGGSITSDNKPLYIVDGFPVESISDISPSNIESIDVLKDASSSAIYGSRGSNGIVLVTTKSGQKGKVLVSYNAYYGQKKAAKMLDVLDPTDYLNWQYELCQLQKQQDYYTNIFGSYEDIPQYANQGVDWQDKVFGRTGNVFNQDLTISGGTDKMRMNFSYGHLDEKAILMYSSFKRDNFSLKTDWTPNDKVAFNFSARYSKSTVRGDGQSTTTGNPNELPSDAFGRIKHSVYQCPFDIENVNETGATIDDLQDYDGEDPLTVLTENYKHRERLNYNLNGSVSYNILDNLTFKSEWGLDEYEYELLTYQGSTTYESTTYAQTDYRGMPLAIVTDYTRRTTRNTNTLNYNLENLFKGTSRLSILLGEETIGTESHEKNIRYEGLPDFFDYNYAFKFAGQAEYANYKDYYYPDNTLLSFFSRVNYDYKGKYLMSATLRADGSSKFSKGNRWGYFPSAALAWRASEEDFLKADWLDNLKLRLSFGVSGNNNIPSGQTSRSYSIAKASSWLHLTDQWWTNGTTMANENLKWETTYAWNGGIDFALYNSKLNGSIELYQNTVHDLLMNQTISGSGYATQYQNIGQVQNKGAEITINYSPVRKKDYGLDLSFVISFNKNKVKSLGDLKEGYNTSAYCFSTEITGDYVVAPGYAVGTMRGYETDGWYTPDDFQEYNESTGWILKDGVADMSPVLGSIRPGDLKLVDQNNDHTISDEDNVIIGDANPVHTGGFSISGYAHGFDLSANFAWSWKNDIYNADKIEYTTTRGHKFRNMISRMAGGRRWTNMDSEGNIVNDEARLTELNKNADIWSPNMQKAVFHSWAVEDGSFLRLTTLSLGYTIPQSLSRKFNIDRI